VKVQRKKDGRKFYHEPDHSTERSEKIRIIMARKATPEERQIYKVNRK
jgi:uncharacterized DUF497 family protein